MRNLVGCIGNCAISRIPFYHKQIIVVMANLKQFHLRLVSETVAISVEAFCQNLLDTDLKNLKLNHMYM